MDLLSVKGHLESCASQTRRGGNNFARCCLMGVKTRGRMGKFRLRASEIAVLY